MMKNRKPDGCREVLKLKIAIVTGASSGMGREFALQIPQLYKNLNELWVVARRTDRLKSLQEQVKIPVRIFDGDMQRDYIFEKLQRELDRRQADVRMLVNAAGYGKIGNVSDIDLKEQCGMVDLNCTALTRMTGRQNRRRSCRVMRHGRLRERYRRHRLSIWLRQLRSVHSRDSVYMRLPKHMYCVFHRDWQQN